MPDYGLNLVLRRARPWYLSYGSAVVAVAVALGLTWLLPAIRTGAPFVFFFLAVTISALFGGYRAGLFAIVLSFLTVETWVMPPIGLFRVAQEQVAQLVAFFVVANVMAWLVQRVDRARVVLDEQRESLRITLASIGDAVIATDGQGRVARMNEVAARLTGWPVEDALGKPLDEVFRIVHEETGLAAENPAKRVLEEGSPVALANHTLLIAKDGATYPIEDSAAPIRDREGRMTGVVLIFRDDSERRAREQSLKMTEARLRMALESGRMMAWEWDVQRQRIWTTDTAIEVYGVAAFEEPGVGMGVIHPDDLPEQKRVVEENATHGGGYHTEFRIVRPDNGKTVWVEEWATALKDAQGKVEKVVGVAMDITSRKAAEEEIRRLNGELDRRVQEQQAIFDLAMVGIAVAADPSCQMILRNQTLAEWLGVPKGMGHSKGSAEADALPFMLLRNGEVADPETLPMQRAIAEARSIVNDELEIVRKDGFRLTVVVSTQPIFDPAGRVMGCVSTYTDVAERKAAELALHNLNVLLEQRVAERTAELEEMNRELVEFANSVSHDLRAPLRAITMLSEWIVEEAGSTLSAAAVEHMAKLRQRIERMEKLLTDLSAYSRAGRVNFPTEAVNLGVMIRDIVSTLDAPAGFTTTIVEPMPILMTERLPLETVLRNVIENAIKHHHDPHAGHVWVAVRELDGQYEFCVEDDGPGIAPEQHQRIFKVFQTLRPRDEVEGSGMGLAVAQRYVMGRGGTISIDSEAGAGMTVRFTWPK